MKLLANTRRGLTQARLLNAILVAASRSAGWAERAREARLAAEDQAEMARLAEPFMDDNPRANNNDNTRRNINGREPL